MEIPGYYYDSEKGRYFKVENSKTAPTSAAWSTDNVKKRRLRDEDEAAARRHLNLAKNRIRRARALNEPLMGGFFAREYGAMKSDMQTACFVEGMRYKGCASVFPQGEVGQVPQVKRMYVGQDPRTGMCIVYAANETTIYSTYIPRDKNHRLDQRLLANYRMPYHLPPPFSYRVIPDISDIQYHEPSNRMILTSRQPLFNNLYNSLWSFSPKFDDDNDNPLCPRWVLSPQSFVKNKAIVSRNPQDLHYEGHCVAPAPADAPPMCALGTSRGIVQWDRGCGRPVWLTPPAPQQPNPTLHSQSDLFRDVFAADFQPGQSAVLRFGGRPGALFTADIRVPCTTWSHLKLPSTITHLKCLDGGNQVLVAGLQSQLGVYDLRFVRSHRGAGGDDVVDIDTPVGDRSNNGNGRGRQSQWSDSRGRNHNRNEKAGKWRDKHTRKDKGKGDKDPQKDIALPLIQFEHYRNNAHIDIGFAYDAATGVVAAALDNVPGTVALYSVRTGSRLRVLDPVSEERMAATPTSRSRPRAARGMQPPIIQSLQFQKFPGDYTPTLFVGAGEHGSITAFSFGVDDLEDEA
ncbi:hypothetical protein HD806DRAFT_328652 [Xylariaceae sp. AK1471]|nr:hypothetical protein HD806DRAFT_328652 [Xylariaceae sp. AK1471]